MRKILVLALGVALLAALPALAAKPPKNAAYRGTTSQERMLSAHVTADAKALRLGFDLVYRCNRGPTKTSHVTFDKQRPTIREDGTFSYFKTYRDLAPVPGFGERHTERQRVTGSFGAGARTLKGRIAISVAGRSGLRCKATVTFSARKHT
jgi:hypothetical protein